MIKEFIADKEKKVEYIELIYDLVFVYVIGRNNLLLHHTDDGFLTVGTVGVYIVCTLAIIQIWTHTTYYVNMYGRRSIREHVFMFLNMFLLYFMAEGINQHWERYHIQFHIAWALILLNIAVQYYIELRRHTDPAHRKHTLTMAVGLTIEALVALLAIGEYQLFSTSFCSVAAVLFGFGFTIFFGVRSDTATVDFAHLSERAMLYVVFTFGEMIIAIAGYFDGAFTLNSFYYSLMAFLIVVGLFLSYGVIYDRIVDREQQTNGLFYMLVHIFLIFALNNITVGLEFMRDDTVRLYPKLIFLIASYLMYFGFLLLCSRFARSRCRFTPGFYLLFCGGGLVFVGLMLLFSRYPMVNIAISAAFVFGAFFYLYVHARRFEREELSDCK